MTSFNACFAACFATPYVVHLMLVHRPRWMLAKCTFVLANAKFQCISCRKIVKALEVGSVVSLLVFTR